VVSPLLCARAVYGRRSHARFSVSSGEGILSVLRDVAVTRSPTGETFAVDREPRTLGEVVTLEMRMDSTAVSTRMRVVAVRPIVRDGSVCYQLTLEPINEDAKTIDFKEIR